MLSSFNLKQSLLNLIVLNIFGVFYSGLGIFLLLDSQQRESIYQLKVKLRR